MSQRTNDPYDRPPVEGQFNLQNADRYDDPSVDPRATGPGSGFGLAEGQQARQTDARLAQQGQSQTSAGLTGSNTSGSNTSSGLTGSNTSSGLTGSNTSGTTSSTGAAIAGQAGQKGGPGGLGSQPGQNLPQQDRGGRAAATDAKIAQNAAQGLQSDASGGQAQQQGLTGGTSGGATRGNDPYNRPPVEGQFNLQNADRYDDPSVDPRATGPGSGFGLAEGQQARQTDARLASQGQQQSGTGAAVGGAAGGLAGGAAQSGQGQRDPYDRPPVEGKFNMQNADRYDDPSVDARATGPGSGFGLAEGKEARAEDQRLGF